MGDSRASREVFGFLAADQVKAIGESGERLNFKAGEVVYERGDQARDFYVVLSGDVTLRLPGRGGVSVIIDQLHRGSIFGGALSSTRPSYALTAQCTENTRLLRIGSDVLTRLMERDPAMGYRLQACISRSYFKRYIDTLNKLHGIVMNLPVEADTHSESPTKPIWRSHHA